MHTGWVLRKCELEQVKDGTETGGAGELKCGSGREKWGIMLGVARRIFRCRAILALPFNTPDMVVVQGVQVYFQLCGKITLSLETGRGSTRRDASHIGGRGESRSRRREVVRCHVRWVAVCWTDRTTTDGSTASSIEYTPSVSHPKMDRDNTPAAQRLRGDEDGDQPTICAGPQLQIPKAVSSVGL